MKKSKDKNGVEEVKIFKSMTQGDYFGEVALFQSDSKRTCDVVAKTYVDANTLAKDVS